MCNHQWWMLAFVTVVLAPAAATAEEPVRVNDLKENVRALLVGAKPLQGFKSFSPRIPEGNVRCLQFTNLPHLQQKRRWWMRPICAKDKLVQFPRV